MYVASNGAMARFMRLTYRGEGGIVDSIRVRILAAVYILEVCRTVNERKILDVHYNFYM